MESVRPPDKRTDRVALATPALPARAPRASFAAPQVVPGASCDSDRPVVLVVTSTETVQLDNPPT